MPKQRPVFRTDEIARALYPLSMGQLGVLFSDLMLHYAEDHGLNQQDIDSHKEAMLKARPDKLIAERLRIEKLMAIKQTEVDEYAEDLARLNKLAEQEGV